MDVVQRVVQTFGPHGDPILRWVGFAAVLAFTIAFGVLISGMAQGNLLAWLFFVSASGYIAPTIVAFGRHHRNREAIMALNMVAGWTFIGWVVALVWSFTADIEKSSLPSD